MQVLHIDSSIFDDVSVSCSLSATITDELRRENPSATVVHRDLSAEVTPHLDGAIVAGLRATGADDFDDATRAEHARSETLVNELLASDVIVIGAPMYNFSVPSQPKAWTDHVTQADCIFKYTEAGSVELIGDKKVIIAPTRDDMCFVDPVAVMDFQKVCLKVVFGFFGIIDAQFIRVEHLATGPDTRAQVLEIMHAVMHGVVNKVVAARVNRIVA